MKVKEMKYSVVVMLLVWPFFSNSQSADELEIKNRIYQFQEAHNKGELDSMMLIVSEDYSETFLPDISYDASSLREYYKSLIQNPAYRPAISYTIHRIETNNKSALSEVDWEYLLYPIDGQDTLYYAKNRGVIEWVNGDEGWKMNRALGGNIIEENELMEASTKEAIKTKMLDWIVYFENENLADLMRIYDPQVRGISHFNGHYITYQDILGEIKATFSNKKLDVKYELGGLEKLSFNNDLAYTITRWKYRIADNEKEMINIKDYRELTVWKQNDDGQWKIVSFVRTPLE